MDKHISSANGGISFEWDDLRWMDDAYRDAFYGIMGSFGATIADSYIISGCGVVSGGGNKTVSAGYICYEGEVCKVDAHVLAETPGHTYYWTLQTSNDTAGSETMENGASTECYQKRRVVLTSASSPPGSYMPMEAPTWKDKIRSYLLNEANAFTKTQSLFYNSTPASYDAGADLITLGDGNAFICILPAGGPHDVVGFVNNKPAGTIIEIAFLNIALLKNSATLVLPGGADMQIASGGWVRFLYSGSDVWYCIGSYTQNQLDINSLKSTMATKANKAQEAWTYIGDSAAPAFANGWINNNAPNRRASYRKNDMGMVSVRGQVAHTSYAGGKEKIFTLPVGYRPTDLQRYVLPTGNGTNALYFQVSIDTDGDVEMDAMGGSPPASLTFNLDGIHFYVD